MPPEMNLQVCRQCGYTHPPLQPNEICPMAKQTTTTGEVIDLDKFFLSLKNILITNIKKSDIKDHKKLLALLLVKINKYVERYVKEYNKKT